MSALAPTLQAFFTERLIRQRQASPNTIAAYRDTFRLLLTFAQQQTGTKPSQLDLGDLDAELIGAFLDHLEHQRHNSTATRNARLAAIRSLFGYAAHRHPEHAATIARVLAIPQKRGAKTTVAFLHDEEIDALLAAPDRSRWTGRREHALLLTMIQTGLRVSELTGLDGGDITLTTGPHLHCHGKGGLCRIRHSPPYVAPGTMLRLRLWWRARAGIVACQLNIVWAGSETLQEREKGVGRPVATGFAVGRRGAVKCAAFEVHVGVDVLVGGVERLVLDMRVIWQLAPRSQGGSCWQGSSARVGYAVGVERRSPGGRPERSAYRVRAVRWGVDRCAPFPSERSCAMTFVPCVVRSMEGPELVSITLGHPLLDGYLEFVGARGAQNTWLAVAYDLKVFFEVVAKEPAEVTAADVFAFLAAQRAPRRGERVVRIEDGEPGLAARTIARRLSSVAGLFEYLLARGDAGVAVNPVPRGLAGRRAGRRGRGGVRLVRTPRTLPRVLSPSEIDRLLGALRTRRDRAMVLAMLLGGLRRCEVLGLRLGDVRVGERRLHIVRGKGGRERIVPVSGRFFGALGDYLELERPAEASTDACFVVLKGPRRGLALSPSGLDQVLDGARARAGLSRCTCHQLRHTCLTRLREQGMALEAVQAQAGHASIESTRIYLHLANDWLAREYLAAAEAIDAQLDPLAGEIAS